MKNYYSKVDQFIRCNLDKLEKDSMKDFKLTISSDEFYLLNHEDTVSILKKNKIYKLLKNINS